MLNHFLQILRKLQNFDNHYYYTILTLNEIITNLCFIQRAVMEVTLRVYFYKASTQFYFSYSVVIPLTHDLLMASLSGDVNNCACHRYNNYHMTCLKFANVLRLSIRFLFYIYDETFIWLSFNIYDETRVWNPYTINLGKGSEQCIVIRWRTFITAPGQGYATKRDEWQCLLFEETIHRSIQFVVTLTRVDYIIVCMALCVQYNRQAALISLDEAAIRDGISTRSISVNQDWFY